MSIQQADSAGFGFDPEDVSSDFFDGVLAWVQYGGDESKVIGITFDMDAFANKFHREQKVLLAYGARACLLHRDVSMKETLRLIGSLGHVRTHVQGTILILDDTGTSLLFDQHGGLRSLSITMVYPTQKNRDSHLYSGPGPSITHQARPLPIPMIPRATGR
jgi:hypothetical protein